ncbi:hypothetical protein CYMTET_26215, partial [Cymbomonas tetramitiformis]
YVNAETDIFMEWAFLAMILLIPLLGLSCFCCCRQKMQGVCCGRAYRVYKAQKQQMLMPQSHKTDYKVLIGLNVVLALLSGYGVISCFVLRDEEKFMTVIFPTSLLAALIAGTGLYGSASRKKAGKFWILLWYMYLSLLEMMMMFLLAFVSLIKPDYLDTFMHLLSFRGVVAEDEDGMYTEIGIFASVLAVLFLVAVAVTIRVLTATALMESIVSVINNLFILAGGTAAFMAKYTNEQFKTPDTLLNQGVGFTGTTYVTGAMLVLLGTVGIVYINAVDKLKSIVLQGLLAFYVALVGMLLAIFIVLIYRYLDFLATEEDLDEVSKTFGNAYVAGCCMAILFLVFGILATVNHLGVLQLLNQRVARKAGQITRRLSGSFRRSISGEQGKQGDRTRSASLQDLVNEGVIPPQPQKDIVVSSEMVELQDVERGRAGGKEGSGKKGSGKKGRAFSIIQMLTPGLLHSPSRRDRKQTAVSTPPSHDSDEDSMPDESEERQRKDTKRQSLLMIPFEDHDLQREWSSFSDSAYPAEAPANDVNEYDGTTRTRKSSMNPLLGPDPELAAILDKRKLLSSKSLAMDADFVVEEKNDDDDDDDTPGQDDGQHEWRITSTSIDYSDGSIDESLGTMVTSMMPRLVLPPTEPRGGMIGHLDDDNESKPGRTRQKFTD